MKLALAQRNPTVGDFPTIETDLVGCIDLSKRAGVDLMITGELSLCGYPPRDFLEHAHFIDDQWALAERLAARAGDDLSIVLGLAVRNDGVGRPFRNVAAIGVGGRIVQVVAKTLVPSYDVFDEARYFEAGGGGQVVSIPVPDDAEPGTKRNVKVGIAVCEDYWNAEAGYLERPYAIDPVRDQVEQGAQLLVNISASPWFIGKEHVRFQMYHAIARRFGRPIAFVNQVGGQDELLFDGHSMVFAADGTCLTRSPGFVEHLKFMDVPLASPDAPNEEVDRIPHIASIRPGTGKLPITAVGPRSKRVLADALEPRDLTTLHEALVMGARDFLRRCGFTKAVLGISGGIDSALVATIAADTLGPENVIGLAMPGPYSTTHSVHDALELGKTLGIQTQTVPIAGPFEAARETLRPLFAPFTQDPSGWDQDVTEENMQARLRGLTLMAYSNKSGAIVLTTGNKSELAVGYCTLYGDLAGGLAVIADLPKTLVYRLARHLNRYGARIPQNTIEKPPSAELRPNQTDQDSLPPYDVLDSILEHHIEAQRDAQQIVDETGFDRAIVERVLKLVRIAEYKRRQVAPALKVTSKAFGIGRRYPIAHGWTPLS